MTEQDVINGGGQWSAEQSSCLPWLASRQSQVDIATERLSRVAEERKAA